MPLGTSPAARFQAYLTRLRIGVRIWLRVIMWCVIAWAMLTTYVVWRETNVYLPALEHEFFFRWMGCGILLRTPWLNRLALWLPMYGDGGWYTLESFTAWLDGPQFYQAPFPVWFGYYGARTALIPLGLFASLLFWRARQIRRTASAWAV